MCNAWNHHADCQCGFGPPYAFEGTLVPDERTGWLESAVWDAERLRRRLGEISLAREEIAVDLEAYAKAGFPLDRSEWLRLEHIRRKSLVARLRRALGLSDVVTEETSVVSVHLALFKLQAPKLLGCRVTYSQTRAESARGNWSLKVFGVGLGADQAFKLRCKCEFVCPAGECLIVFVPLPFRLSRRLLTKRGRRFVVLSGEVPKMGAERELTHGADSCVQRECSDEVASASPVARFPLAGHEGTGLTKYSIEWHAEGSREIGVEIDALPWKIGPKASIRLESDIALEFQLPGGHDYRVYDLARSHGFCWALD